VTTVVQVLSPRYLADPYSYYDLLRSVDPVSWDHSGKLWLLTRYADVSAALRNPALSSRRKHLSATPVPEPTRQALQSVEQYLATWLIRMDPPAHSRLRSLAKRAFSLRLLERTRPLIQQRANELFDSLQSLSRDVDLIAELFAPLTLTAVADLIGLPRHDHTRFQRWSESVGEVVGGSFAQGRAERAEASLTALVNYFGELIDQRRRHPKNDLLSALVNSVRAGDRLNSNEITSFCALLLLAGHETTTHLLGNGLLSLLQNEAQFRRLRESPKDLSTAIEELLRYDSPLQGLLRIAAEDIEIGGKPIAAGQTIVLWLGSANRDPAQFVCPDQLDLTRERIRHVAFGHGIHSCLGAHLARAIVEIALSTLLRRAPNLRRSSKKIEWHGNFLFRSQNSLRVVLR
jgi:cytochrome P450